VSHDLIGHRVRCFAAAYLVARSAVSRGGTSDSGGGSGSLSLLVQLSSERARHALRQDCSFAKQQDSPPALPVVV
jgi:hypothetical protein